VGEHVTVVHILLSTAFARVAQYVYFCLRAPYACRAFAYRNFVRSRLVRAAYRMGLPGNPLYKQVYARVRSSVGRNLSNLRLRVRAKV